MRRIFLLASVVLALVSCDGGPKPLPEGPLDVRLKAISEHVTKVDQIGDNLMIEHDQKSALNGRAWTWNVLSDAFQIMSRLDEAAKGQKFKTVAIMVKVDTRNNLGQNGSAVAIKMRFDMIKLADAQWSNMTTLDISEVTDELVVTRLGRELVVDYCQDGDRAKYSRKLCSG